MKNFLIQFRIVHLHFLLSVYDFDESLILIVYLQILFMSLSILMVVQIQGTSPQLYACMGWSLLVIGLEIKKARAFNN